MVLALIVANAAAEPVGKDAAGPAPPSQEPDLPAGLLKAIQQREAELAQRADELAKREEQLKVLDQDIRTMVQKYEKLLADIEQKTNQTAAPSRAADNDRFIQLAKVYEQMAPDDAAARIAQMDEHVALKILAAAKPKATAKILTGLPAQKAARFSERLAAERR